MGAQKKITNKISDSGADYVIALKGNQGELHETIKDTFKLIDKKPNSLQIYQAENDICGEHGRIDNRKVEAICTDKFKDYFDN